MKKLTKLAATLAILIALLAVPIYALASDVTNALYSSPIVISNNGTATTNTTTVFTTNTTNMISGGYLNATANNTVLRNSSGADMAFQPGYSPDGNPWCGWVPSIGQDAYLTHVLYWADSTGGKIRYFPGSAGMEVSDNATLEPTDNFSIKHGGFVDTDTGGILADKPGVLTLVTGSGGVFGGIPSDDEVEITISTFAEWHDVDVSAHVPAEASGVVLHYNGAGKDISFREDDGTDNRVYPTNHGWTAVGVTSSGIFEAYVEDNTVNVYIVGWTDDNWVYFTDDIDYSIVALGAWTNVDVSGDCPADTEAVLLDTRNLDAGAQPEGLRMDNSGDARTNDIQAGYHKYMVCGVDAARVYEEFIQVADIDTFLAAYILDTETTFDVNATDYSLVPVGAWTDIDLTPSVTVDAEYAFMEIEINAGFGQTYGMRMDGSAVNELGLANGQSIAIVRMDTATDILEGNISAVAVDFWYRGCAETSIHLPYAVSVTASIPSGEYDLELKADGANLYLIVDTVTENTAALGGASVLDVADNWTFVEAAAMPYMEYQEILIGGEQRQYIVWEYDTVFHDSSGYDQDAIPSFRTTSADADISANMTGFRPISQAQAPAYILGATSPFLSDISGNVTGSFTIVPPAGTFPLAGVIVAIANATATPPQLPLLIIAAFIILAASLTTSALLRRYGSGTLIIKAMVIVFLMGFFVAVKNFGIDFWMVVIFCILATGIAMMSKQTSWT